MFALGDHAISSLTAQHVGDNTQAPHVSGLESSIRIRARVKAKSPVVEGVPLEKGPSPIRVTVLDGWLTDYSHRDDAHYLLKGFKYGFRILAVGEHRAFFCTKPQIVYGMEGVVQNKIVKELKGGRVLGPFSVAPLENLRVSPLGIVQKRDQGEFKLIHHCLLQRECWSTMPSLRSFAPCNTPLLTRLFSWCENVVWGRSWQNVI